MIKHECEVRVINLISEPVQAGQNFSGLKILCNRCQISKLITEGNNVSVEDFIRQNCGNKSNNF